MFQMTILLSPFFFYFCCYIHKSRIFIVANAIMDIVVGKEGKRGNSDPHMMDDDRRDPTNDET